MKQGMTKMKTAKIFLNLAMVMGAYGPVSAQISPFVSAQVDTAAKPCLDLAGASAGLPDAQAKAVATASLGPCNDALRALDAFEKTNGPGLSPEEINYFYYIGGNVIWISAAAEVIKNNGQLNADICTQVASAESAWGNVNVPLGTQVDIQMRTNTIRAMLLPPCQQAQ